MRRGHTGLLALAAALLTLALPAGAGAAGTTTIDFQAVGDGDQITDQYLGQGLLFGTATDFGPFPAGACGAPRGQTIDGISGRSALISCSPGEFKGPLVGAAFEFQSERRAVTLKLKATDDNIPVTVSIHAIGGGQLASQSLTLPLNTVVPVSFTRATPEIAVVRISGGNVDGAYSSQVFMDDVTAPIEDVPPPPKFSLVLQKPTVDLIEGSTVSVPVSVRRYNGSVGPVDLSVPSLPSGITGTQFTPNPVTGRDAATLKISGSSPLSGDRQITVTASKPAGAPASVGVPVAATGQQTVRGIPALSFGNTARGVVKFVPGCPSSFREGVQVRGGYTGSISVDTTTILGGSVPTTPGTVVAGGDGFLNFDYPMSFPGPGAGVVRLKLTPTKATPVSVDIPVETAPPIADVSPTVVSTPRRMQPGTTVTLTGEGLCASADSRVRFGNANADAKIISSSPDGRRITTTVPRLATTGKVQLVPDFHNPKTVLDGPPVTVDSYRNSVGFAFHNFTPHLTVDQMSTAFGQAATHIYIDACGTITFGLVKCKVKTPIPDPWAMFVLEVANRTMGGSSGGACFGFSRTSQQLRQGRRPYTGLGNDAAKKGFDLPGPAGPNGSINEAINANQLTQLSSEYVGYYLGKAVGNTALQTPSSLRRDVEQHLRAGDDPLLSLREGGTVDNLHVVVAYDVEDDPAEPGAYYIDVYDSNMPFIAPGYKQGDQTADTFEDTDADTHKTRTEGSRIHVHANSHWELPSTSNMSASSLGNIIVGGIDNPGPHPTLVTASGALKSGISVLLGTVAGALFSQNGQPAAPPASTTQVSAGGRRLFSEPGVLNTDSRTALKATPWAPSTGSGSGVDGFILGAGAGADYSVDKGGRAGTQTRTLLSGNAISQVTSATRTGVTDKLSISPSDAGVGFTSGKGAVPLTLETMTRAAGGATRSVQLKTKGSADAIAFAGGGVRIKHGGAPATVQLTLSSSGQGLPQAARVSLRLAGKGTTTLKPASWARLSGGTVTVRSNGKARSVRLSGQRVRGATVSGLKVAGRVARARVSVPATASGRGTVTFVATQGRRVIATKSLSAGGAGKRTVSWKLPAKVRKGARVTAVATSLITRGSIFNSATSKRSAPVR